MNVFAMMMRLRWVAAALCVSFCLSGCGLLGVVYFPDKALESAVRASLDQPFGPLFKSGLAKVRELQAPSLNITTLDGLEYCTSLTVLNLRGNQVNSITPLTTLNNLVRLDLGENQIKNIEPLAGMVHLEELVIYGTGNEIVDWQPLAANSQAGGLGAGNVVVLPTETTTDSDGNPLPNFAPTREVLLNNGVTIIIGSPQTQGATTATTTSTAK
jgi:predicted small lipoprotein YifL